MDYKSAIKKAIKNLRKPSCVLLILSTLVGGVITIAYVYVTFSSALGLVISCVTGFGNLFTLCMIAWNTSVEKKQHYAINYTAAELDALKSKAILFFIFAISCALLNSASHFISTFKSIILLGTLGIGLSSSVFFGLGIGIAILIAISVITYDIIQTYEVCERIYPFNDKPEISSIGSITPEGQTEQVSATLTTTSVLKQIQPDSFVATGNNKVQVNADSAPVPFPSPIHHPEDKAGISKSMLSKDVATIPSTQVLTA